jgi:hypothetical protein
MEPIPKLNRAILGRCVGPTLAALFIAGSVGLLFGLLAAIYARSPVKRSTEAPAGPAPRREDARLFDQALAAGLLRLEADGRIGVAPADLPLRRSYALAHPALLVPDADGSSWLEGPWNDESLRLHRALHFSAAGRYVRQQVGAFNANRLLAAIRWRSDASAPGDWRADLGEAPLTLIATVPPAFERLFGEDGEGWRPWRRVAHWPALKSVSPVTFRLNRSGERLDLLVIGVTPSVAGATVVAREFVCSDSAPCAESAAIGHRLRLERRAGIGELVVSFSPLPAIAVPDLFQSEGLPVRREGGWLLWREAPAENGADSSRPLAAPPDSREGRAAPAEIRG